MLWCDIPYTANATSETKWSVCNSLVKAQEYNDMSTWSSLLALPQVNQSPLCLKNHPLCTETHCTAQVCLKPAPRAPTNNIGTRGRTKQLLAASNILLGQWTSDRCVGNANEYVPPFYPLVFKGIVELSLIIALRDYIHTMYQAKTMWG